MVFNITWLYFIPFLPPFPGFTLNVNLTLTIWTLKKDIYQVGKPPTVLFHTTFSFFNPCISKHAGCMPVESHDSPRATVPFSISSDSPNNSQLFLGPSMLLSIVGYQPHISLVATHSRWADRDSGTLSGGGRGEISNF